MALNPKAFTGVPPAPPPQPRIGLPPRPRFNLTPAMIQVPAQPTLADVMVALDIVNKNIANLSKQIDDGFYAEWNCFHFIESGQADITWIVRELIWKYLREFLVFKAGFSVPPV